MLLLRKWTEGMKLTKPIARMFPVIIGLSVGFLFCLSDAALAADASGDLFPLKPKNWWSYQTNDGNGATKQIKYEVVSAKQNKDGQTVFKVELAGSKSTEAKYYFKQGFKTMLQKVESKSQPSLTVEYLPSKLIIDSNIRPGSIFQWTGANMKPVGETERWQVYPVERVKVPAGEFDCVRIGGLTIRNGVMVYQTRWFAKNVGLVKAVDVKDSKKASQELTAFRVY